MGVIKANGVSQGDLVTLLTNVVALVNECKATANTNVALANECKASINAVNAKLDADAGVTDTDYAATHDVASADSAAVAGTDLTLSV